MYGLFRFGADLTILGNISPGFCLNFVWQQAFVTLILVAKLCTFQKLYLSMIPRLAHLFFFLPLLVCLFSYIYFSKFSLIHCAQAVNNLTGMELQRVLPGKHGNFDKIETCRKTTVNDFLQSIRQSKISGRNKSWGGAVKRPLQAMSEVVPQEGRKKICSEHEIHRLDAKYTSFC